MQHYATTQNWGTLIARILFSSIFVLAALNKIFYFNDTIAYMTHYAIPYPKIVAVIAIIFELGGGLLVLFGLYARFGAFLLFIFILTVSFAIHHFWTYPPSEMMEQMINFQKNFAMLAATLYIMCFGAGAYSLDHSRLHRRIQ